MHSRAVSHHRIDNKSTSVRGEAVDPSEFSEGGYRWFHDEKLLHYAFSLVSISCAILVNLQSCLWNLYTFQAKYLIYQYHGCRKSKFENLGFPVVFASNSYLWYNKSYSDFELCTLFWETRYKGSLQALYKDILKIWLDYIEAY